MAMSAIRAAEAAAQAMRDAGLVTSDAQEATAMANIERIFQALLDELTAHAELRDAQTSGGTPVTGGIE